MRNFTRFTPGEDIGDVAEWRFHGVDAASLLLAAKEAARVETPDLPTTEAVRQAGYAEGFAQGHAQATLEAQRQIQDYIDTQGKDGAQRFSSLFESASAQLAQAEQVMARGVLDLACELARQVLRHELSLNPNALQPVVREALGLLVTDGKHATVRLNPLDLEILEDALREEFSSLSLTLLADASVNRGGCLIESAGTVVDGSLEKRWMRAVANLGLSVPWEGPADER
jgi:flagellar assembly protein FliH